MGKIKVSVIISTYNRPELLEKTIESLKQQDFSGYEVIVVDNACSDNMRILLESQIRDADICRCSIKYIQEPNIGLHNARHAGAKIAQGEILLYVDDDVITDKNLLQEVVEPYSDPDVGCVGGKILPKWEVEPPELLSLFPNWYLSILDDDGELREVNYIYGCNFSIRRNLLFELGGFNPDAFGHKKMWWYRGDGEIGLLRKVHSVGKKVIYNPKAVVWHFIPKERLTVEYFKERAFKSGIEASFSKYRYSNNSLCLLKLLLGASVFGMYYIFHTILAFIPSKEGIRHKVTSSYYKARCLYELRSAVDRNLQKFVKREKWLE